MFKSIISCEALDDFKNISPDIAIQIKKRIDEYLVQSPKELGKVLTGKKYKGLFRYRYGNYRILYEIDSKNNIIIINKIGHRSQVY
jgi:mRNA interferase RelE/StbE